MNTPWLIFAAAYFTFWTIGRIAERGGPSPLGTGATLLLGAFSAGCAALMAIMSGGMPAPGAVSFSTRDAAQAAAALVAACGLSAAEKKLNILGRNPRRPPR